MPARLQPLDSKKFCRCCRCIGRRAMPGLSGGVSAHGRLLIQVSLYSLAACLDCQPAELPWPRTSMANLSIVDCGDHPNVDWECIAVQGVLGLLLLEGVL
eukprot:59108-Amphidinium_carterae.4